jgi:hypothetical protein
MISMTADGVATISQIDRSRTGSITIEPMYNSATVRVGTYEIYYVAKLKGSGYSFALTDAFQAAVDRSVTDLDINKARSASEIQSAARILAGLKSEITPAVTITLPQDSGRIQALGLGIYLIVNTSVPNRYIAANPFLVYLPLLEESAWVYDITAHPKLGYDNGNTTTTTTPRRNTTTSTIPPLSTLSTTSTTSTVVFTEPEIPYDVPTTPLTTEPAPSVPDITDDPKPPDDEKPPDEDKELKDPKIPFGLPQTGMLQWPALVLSFCGAAFITGGVVVNKKRKSGADANKERNSGDAVNKKRKK